GRARPLRQPAVQVEDERGAAGDTQMPRVAAALDPFIAQRMLSTALSSLDSLDSPRDLSLHAIRTVRHKPGQRCLIEYDVTSAGEKFTIMGKLNANGLDETGHCAWIWLRQQGGFGLQSADGISVPEPLGVIPALFMTLYRKVQGVVATDLLSGAGGGKLAARIADAAYKLHRANLPFQRSHTMADELRVLRDRLRIVATFNPQWSGRIDHILQGCD